MGSDFDSFDNSEKRDSKNIFEAIEA